MKVDLFISYSHKDSEYKEELLTHLSPIIRHKYLNPWHDGKIDAGDDWEKQISSALNKADIVLLLISANFINSQYCYDKEMEVALARHSTGDAVIIPVLLKNCLWQETVFAMLQAIPHKPVDSFDNRDDAFTEIAKAINTEVQFQYHIKLGDKLVSEKKFEEAEASYKKAEDIKSTNLVEKKLEFLNRALEGRKADFTDGVSRKPVALNNARFINDGFIGLQKQINIIESSNSNERGYERLAVLGHLPSFMRLNPLQENVGRLLYYNWEPEYYINEYVELVNQRAEFFHQYIESGGISRDILFKKSIKNYVINRFTFHDKNEDPIEEIEERVKTLLHYNRKRNYYLYLLDEEKTVPKFILKTNVGLVIDLRTTGVSKHFTHSIDGLFSQSEEIIMEFRRKFSNLIDIQHVNRVSANEEFLQSLLTKIEDFKNGQ